ncbi:hypothetical protein ACJ2A9_01795 [Anaerobacillus sp. MEB173]|uniref:hypothetical protein n=1 Tax=Anaerobacillus sp. MEB173 TaxID=3383345 RepID=UPI003F92DF0D
MKLKNSIVSFITVLVVALTLAGQVSAAGGGGGSTEAASTNPLLIVVAFLTLAYFVFVTVRES